MDIGVIEWHGQRSMYSCAVGRVLNAASHPEHGRLRDKNRFAGRATHIEATSL